MNLYRRPIGFTAALAALLLVPALGAWAQTGGTAASAPAKVGILNVRLAIGSTAEGKQANVQLQVQFTPQTTDLDNIQRQIQDLQNRLNSGARTLSEDEKARLQRQGEMLQRQFQRKQEDLNDQLTAAQSDIVDEIGRKMLDVLDKYSKEKGIGLVIDSSAQGSPLVYGSPQLDVTDDIIRLYDQAHPPKTAAAPAPRPATPATPATAAPKSATPATPAVPARP